jgi:imidazole glycerol-phosphate synthase subunit HisH
LKIPHIGWNSLHFCRQSPLFQGIDEQAYVYFVHSYYLKAQDRQIVTSQTEYGVTIDASVAQGNLYATQFHPEKSGAVGLQMLRNFAALVDQYTIESGGSLDRKEDHLSCTQNVSSLA